jgi:hypothetical protein
MGASLDLRKAHAHHNFGEIVQILTWVNDERAMVLVPAHRKNAPWFIVCESAAWKYGEDRYLVEQSKKAAEALGMEGAHTWLKIAAIIEEGLPDLIRMPSAPMPSYLKSTFGHMELRENGKTIASEDIKIETEGAEYAPATVH